MTDLTPHPWHWDEDGQLIGDGGFLIISAGINKAGGAYVSVSEEDQSAIATTPELLEALKLAADEINAIRARDGHPVSYQFGPNGPIRIDLCTDEWWDELTEKCFAAIAKATGGTS